MLQPQRRSRGFTLVELLVVIAIIALLLAIIMPVLGKATKAARSTACRSGEGQLWKGVRIYLNNNDEYFPLAWHVGGSVSSELGNLTYMRFIIQEETVSGWSHAITPRDTEVYGSVQAAREAKFKENEKFWRCPETGWTRHYFSPLLIFKWPSGTMPYDKHRQLGEVTQEISDVQRPLLTEVNASVPDDEAEDRNDSQHQQEMRNGFNYVTYAGMDIFVGVGKSLRQPGDWDTGRFDYRHNDGINVLYLDGHVDGIKRTNQPQLARLHRRWNSLTINTDER